MNGYKLCRIENNKFISLIGNSYNYEIVTYQLNEWAYPKDRCGPLAVFESIDYMKQFLHGVDWGDIKCFYCKYEPSDEKYLFSLEYKRCYDLPNGTVLAKKIKLLEDVTDTIG